MARTNGTAAVSPPKRSGGGVTAAAPAAPPTPEVTAQASRRRFPVDYKLAILRQADACRAPGEVGALLRREGLYSSHLAAWRKQRDAGALSGEGRRRGPKSQRPDPRTLELERENRRLRRELDKAQLLIELQKKLALALGIPLSDRPPDESEP